MAAMANAAAMASVITLDGSPSRSFPRRRNRARSPYFGVQGYDYGRSDNALAAYYRRLALRIGTPKAITATARKLAVIIYNMLKHGVTYHEVGAETYNRRQTARRLRRLTKQAQELGYQVIPNPTPTASMTPVS